MSIFHKPLNKRTLSPRRGHQQSHLNKTKSVESAVQREKNPMKKPSTISLAEAINHLDLPQTLSYLCQVGQGVFNQ